MIIIDSRHMPARAVLGRGIALPVQKNTRKAQKNDNTNLSMRSVAFPDAAPKTVAEFPPNRSPIGSEHRLAAASHAGGLRETVGAGFNHEKH
jgi:hypothetical protein